MILNRRNVLGLAAATTLAGCAGKSSPDGTLTFWTVQLSPQFDDYVATMLAAFEASHPGINVRWVDVPWADIERKLLASVAAGTAPDVVNLNPQFAARLAQAGALADPTDYITAADAAVFLPTAWNGNRFRGRLFALPWYLSTPVALINRSLFAAAEMKPPAKMADLPAAAIRLRAKTGKYAYFPSLDGSRPMEDMILLGARLLNATGDGAGFDTVGGRRAFGFYRDLYQSGAVPRDILTEGHQKALDLFQSGELAMLITGMEALGTIKLNAPSLMPQLAVMPQPAGANVPPPIAAMNLAVPMAARDKAAAFALARFVTGPAWQSRLALRAPVLPSAVASLKSPPFNQPEREDPLLAEARAISVQQLVRGQVLVPPLPNYGKLRSSLRRNIESAMVGQLTVDEAVTRTAQTWNALLSRSGPAA